MEKNKGWIHYKQEINFEVFLFSQRNGYNGLMESTDKNEYNLGPIRGSCLSEQVQKSFTVAEVLSAGILKHSNHDQFFCSSENYLLLYPDQKVVTSIPGSE